MTLSLFPTAMAADHEVAGVLLRDRWRTPSKLIVRLLHHFGRTEHFDLDACAERGASHGRHYISADQDCLVTPWLSVLGPRDVATGPAWVWQNMPFSAAPDGSSRKPVFLRRAHHEAQTGMVVLSIVPATTAESWWGEIWDLADWAAFITPRLAYVPPPGVKASHPNQVGQCLFRFTPKGYRDRHSGKRLGAWRWR